MRSTDMTRLGDLASILIGPPFKSKVFRSARSGTRLLRGMNLGPDGTRWDECFLWPDEELAPYSKYLLAPGDLCVAMDATFTNAGRIRAGIIQAEDLPSLLVQRVARLRVPNPTLRKFVWLLLTSDAFRDHLRTGRRALSPPTSPAGTSRASSPRSPRPRSSAES